MILKKVKDDGEEEPENKSIQSRIDMKKDLEKKGLVDVSDDGVALGS